MEVDLSTVDGFMGFFSGFMTARRLFLEANGVCLMCHYARFMSSNMQHFMLSHERIKEKSNKLLNSILSLPSHRTYTNVNSCVDTCYGEKKSADKFVIQLW